MQPCYLLTTLLSDKVCSESLSPQQPCHCDHLAFHLQPPDTVIVLTLLLHPSALDLILPVPLYL
eukprot:scaffold269298_cov24-Tisochrysis_lutea.AAC.1